MADINKMEQIEHDNETSFSIIAEAGDSKGYAMDAIRAARAGDYEKAEELLKQADEAMARAHDAQFDLLQRETSDNPATVNVLLIHAQDHMTMAIVAHDLAEEMIALYKELNELKAGK